MNPTSSSSNSKKKETPGDIRKQKKRIEESRDALKEKNRKKRQQIKAQFGKLDDLTKSRDMWKNRSEEYIKEIDQLNRALEEEKKNRLHREVWIKEQENIFAQHIQEDRARQIEYEKKIDELKKKLRP